MKKSFICLLLIGLVFQSTSQLWIMTSFYIQREYIANNLCINRFNGLPLCRGKCYLAKELKENEKKQEHRLPDVKVQLYAVARFSLNLCPAYGSCAEKIPLTDLDIHLSGYIFSVFHPPKQA